MILALTFGFVALIGVNIALLYLVNKRVSQYKAQFTAYLQSFFNSPSENEPSEFAKLTTVLIDQLSQRVVMQFKTVLMGVESVQARKAQAVNAALIEDSITNQNPVIGGLLATFPSLAKVLGKNPQGLAAIMSLAGGMGKGNNGGNHPESSGVKYNPGKFG